MSTLAQIVGILLITAGASVLWSAWALIIGGILLVIVPEIATAVRRPRPGISA